MTEPGGLLDLPSGFQYHVVSAQGTTLSNGAPVPGDFDGMAAFPGPSSNTAVLVRNHELRPSDLSPTGDDAPVYDPVFGGNPYDSMTLGSKLVTRPSDPTGERPIGDAVVLLR